MIKACSVALAIFLALQVCSCLHSVIRSPRARASLPTMSMSTLAHQAESLRVKVSTNLVERGMTKQSREALSMLILSPKLILAALKSVLAAFFTRELYIYAFFRLTYRKMLRAAHKAQILVWNILALGKPLDWNQSVIGFVEDNCGLLAQLMGANYLVKVAVSLLYKLGFFRIKNDFPVIFSKVVYTFYVANFLDLFKAKYMRVFFPRIAESRRQSYVVNRSLSVTLWMVAFLTACEMISTYLKVPLSSTLAFGGVGGLAVGLSARDIAANFLGGMLLLFNEPFTPGDMVTFRYNKQDITGRVERVGWGQTRLRGKDTRPTYVPNSHFVQTAVTNMERITHRKYDSTISLRFEDSAVLPDVLANIKDALRQLPKLDALSMPFRVNLVKFSEYALVIEITCYFATKSIDEYLALQQTANLEVLRVVRECGAQLALPTSIVTYKQKKNSSGGEGSGSGSASSQPPGVRASDKTSVAAAIAPPVQKTKKKSNSTSGSSGSEGNGKGDKKSTTSAKDKGTGDARAMQRGNGNSVEGVGKSSITLKPVVAQRDQVAPSTGTSSDMPEVRKPPAVMAPPMAVSRKESAEPYMQSRPDLYNPEGL